MSNIIRLTTDIIVMGLAGATVYASVKRRLMLMTVLVTLLQVLLGTQQLIMGYERWLVYLSFSAAALGLVSTIVQLMRRKHAP